MIQLLIIAVYCLIAGILYQYAVKNVDKIRAAVIEKDPSLEKEPLLDQLLQDKLAVLMCAMFWPLDAIYVIYQFVKSCL